MNEYYRDSSLLIRKMKPEDAQTFYDTYLSYGWHPSMETYERYYAEQQQDKRKVFIAEYQGKIVGICTLLLNPDEGPWANQGIPEIADLSVFIPFRNKGIGNRLLESAEQQAFQYADKVTLAVGLHNGYGAAQRIYVRRGYLFDGSGVWYQNKPLAQYAPCANDDDLLLYMSKDRQ